MRRIAATICVTVAVAGCAQTSVTQMSRNEIMVTTSAAPVCGVNGSQQVAQAMVAVETLRRGFERYIIGGAQSRDNTTIVQTGPTYANTYSTATVSGNTAYGSSTTYYGGQSTMIMGSHDTAMRVVMFKPGDPGYEQGVDAKATLGPEWEKKVKDGVDSCF